MKFIIKKNTEFYQQYLAIKKEYNQISQNTKYKIHPTEILTSRFLDFNNLPESQNLPETSEQYGGSKNSFNLDDINLDELNLKDSENSQLSTRQAFTSWQSIHPNFTPQLTQSWLNHHFTYQQTQDWINIGLNPQDYQFAHFLKTQKNLTPEEALNEHQAETLRQEFINSQQSAQIIQINPFNK